MKTSAKTYCVTIAAVAVAAILRWLLTPILTDGAPFSTFILAVIFVSWYGGLRAAIVATVLGFGVAFFLFILPHFSVLNASVPSIIRFALYFIVCFAITAFGEAMRIAQNRSHLAEQLARQQAETLRLTFASIGDAVITTDVAGSITYLNAVAQDLTGWTVEEARGQLLTKVFNTIGEPSGHPLQNSVAAPSKRGELANHTVLFSQHGVKRVIDQSTSTIRDDAGRDTGQVVIFRDISARRQIEYEREEAQQQIMMTLESITDAFVRFDRDWKIAYVNAEAERLIGRSRFELLGKICWDESLPGVDAQVEQEFRRAVAENITIEFESYDELSERWFVIKGNPTSYGGLTVFVHDITSHKQAEELLRQSEHRVAQELADMTRLQELVARLLVCPNLESALDEVLDATIALLSADMGHVQLFNPKSGTLEIVAQRGFHQDFLEYFRTVSRNDNTASGRSLVEGCRTMYEDIQVEPTYEQHRKIAASAGYRSIQATPLLDRAGRPLGMLSTHYHQPHRSTERELRLLDLYARQAADFIERTRNEMALRESEARYRAIGEAIDFGVWMCDPEGQTTYASESFLRLIGITQQQCFDFGWGKALHPDEAEDAVAAWKKCVRTNGTWDREHRFQGVDGKWHDILSRGVPVRSDAGQLLGWVGINLDISRLKQAEESLRQADRRKDEFLATLAHELRNPLAPMRNAIQLLHTNASDISVLESARDVIDRQIQQMTRLIDDLLDVSRITRNRLELRKERVELRKAIESALEASRPLIEENGHELTIDLPDESLVLDADLTRLAQVFLNLLNNAAKYTERGGHIELCAKRQGTEVVISISDTGIGIPVDKLPTLFQMFSQVEDSISRSRGGLGIGLSLVKSLIEMHGGKIEARSEGLGKGSTFSITLPLVFESSRAPHAKFDSDRKASASQLQILVVDDNVDAANTLTMILQLMGNQVRTVHDGEAAVEMTEEFVPDVVLLDIGLPKMNGYDVARWIRKQSWSSNTVLIAVTGWGQDSDKRQAMEAGFDQHLVKPVNPQVLLKILGGIQRAKHEEPVMHR